MHSSAVPKRNLSLGDTPKHLDNRHLAVNNSATLVLCSRPDKSTSSPLQFGAFRSFEERSESARNQAMQSPDDLRTMPFPAAAEWWLSQKHNRESTLNCYRDYLVRLNKFFTMPLGEIHIGHIVTYQAQMKKQYHPASVNHDINTLSQVMRRADLWTPIAEHYRLLPLPEVDPPKVMSEAEEDRFFEFAAKNQEWCLAYWVASLTNNSTASGKELRMLQLGSISMESDSPSFRVPKNMKTPNRPRDIPLNERGAQIMERLINRANSLGSTRQDHFLFPLRIKRNLFDPTKPASESWIKYRWKLLVDAARSTCMHCAKDRQECACRTFAPILSFKLKPHNLRHQIITKLLESGTPIETVRHIAGHGVDSVATRIYSHGRMAVMARALQGIDPGSKRPVPAFPPKKGKGVSA